MQLFNKPAPNRPAPEKPQGSVATAAKSPIPTIAEGVEASTPIAATQKSDAEASKADPKCAPAHLPAASVCVPKEHEQLNASKSALVSLTSAQSADAVSQSSGVSTQSGNSTASSFSSGSLSSEVESRSSNSKPSSSPIDASTIAKQVVSILEPQLTAPERSQGDRMPAVAQGSPQSAKKSVPPPPPTKPKPSILKQNRQIERLRQEGAGGQPAAPIGDAAPSGCTPQPQPLIHLRTNSDSVDASNAKVLVKGAKREKTSSDSERADMSPDRASAHGATRIVQRKRSISGSSRSPLKDVAHPSDIAPTDSIDSVQSSNALLTQSSDPGEIFSKNEQPDSFLKLQRPQLARAYSETPPPSGLNRSQTTRVQTVASTVGEALEAHNALTNKRISFEEEPGDMMKSATGFLRKKGSRLQRQTSLYLANDCSSFRTSATSRFGRFDQLGRNSLAILQSYTPKSIDAGGPLARGASSLVKKGSISGQATSGLARRPSNLLRIFKSIQDPAGASGNRGPIAESSECDTDTDTETESSSSSVEARPARRKRTDSEQARGQILDRWRRAVWKVRIKWREERRESFERGRQLDNLIEEEAAARAVQLNYKDVAVATVECSAPEWRRLLKERDALTQQPDQSSGPMRKISRRRPPPTLQELQTLVVQGVPKQLRGRVWLLLADEAKRRDVKLRDRIPAQVATMTGVAAIYRDLQRRLTRHDCQRQILIDLGRSGSRLIFI